MLFIAIAKLNWIDPHALLYVYNKLHHYSLRFEMPYDIWCGGCGIHIAQSVRYNAEKQKVGMYYTTPIWQFRMRCHLCPQYFEIKTDPAVILCFDCIFWIKCWWCFPCFSMFSIRCKLLVNIIYCNMRNTWSLFQHYLIDPSYIPFIWIFF